jgi:hypothetical protein
MDMIKLIRDHWAPLVLCKMAMQLKNEGTLWIVIKKTKAMESIDISITNKTNHMFSPV